MLILAVDLTLQSCQHVFVRVIYMATRGRITARRASSLLWSTAVPLNDDAGDSSAMPAVRGNLGVATRTPLQ